MSVNELAVYVIHRHKGANSRVVEPPESRGSFDPKFIPVSDDKGFVCSHVNHLGLMGRKDWELKAATLDGDWTFITNNGVDFRRPAKQPGSQGVYADISLHAGLVCVDA